jgi:solute carrier family 35 protein F1/2
LGLTGLVVVVVVVAAFAFAFPCLLQICGATMLNLSLLTSDMWAVLIRIFAYHEKVCPLHCIPLHIQNS